MISFENFDNNFETGLSKIKNVAGTNSSKADIIDLVRAKSTSDKYPVTLGTASFIPILDRNANHIHTVEQVLPVTIPVANEDHDPTNPKSKPFKWSKFFYIPDYNYKTPLTDGEKAKNQDLLNIITDYMEEFSQYEPYKKTYQFMKVLLIRLKNKNGEILYSNTTEPVVLQHTSAKFSQAYSAMIKATDETYGREWRRNVYLPDGKITNMITCTTEKPSGKVGYDVSFNYFQGVETGKSLSREHLKAYMDYDINEIGFNTTEFDARHVQFSIDMIEEAWNVHHDIIDGFKADSEG